MTKTGSLITMTFFAGMLALIAVRPADGSGLFNELQRPYDPARAKIRTLNNSIGDLLLQMPSVSPRHVSTDAICETYLLIVRQYFKGSLSTRDVALKSVLNLYGDRLLNGYPEFAAMVKQTLGHPNSLAAGIKALAKFQQSKVNFDRRLTSWNRLAIFQKQALGPLFPLVSMSLSKAKPVVIWPIQTAKSATPIPLPPINTVAPISQTIASLPEINIATKLRKVFSGVLRQIQTRLKRHPRDVKAAHYYRVIVHCLTLAQHLQQISVLSLSTQEAFNHRLMLALLFFKDPRTRAGALRRLEFIGRIVGTMELISSMKINPADRAILNRRLHQITTELDSHQHNKPYVRELEALDVFLRAAAALNHLEAEVTQPPYREAQERIELTGSKLVSKSIHKLKDDISKQQLYAAQTQLGVIAANLQRIENMPAARSQALLYHPIPAGGVTRNTVRWAREISINPLITTDAARNVDRFQHTLSLLAGIHLQLLHRAPMKTLNELSGHRYTQFLVLFHSVQQDIINSLSTLHPAPAALRSELHEQLRLLRAVHRLAWLVDHRLYLMRMNIWGAWHWNRAARSMWLHQMQEVIAHRFDRDTRINGRSEAAMSFASAAPAIKTLYRTVRQVAPQLHANANLWAVAYLQVTMRPPPDAIASGQWVNFVEACSQFDDAAANNGHGRFQPAMDLFRRGNRVLAATQVSRQ
jgi:hypothetical protein